MFNSLVWFCRRPSILAAGFLLVFLWGAQGMGTAFAQKDYEEWKEEQEEEYQEYVNEQDKAFAEFLEKQWKGAEAEPHTGTPLSSKPEEIPVADEEPASSSSQDQPSDDVEPGFSDRAEEKEEAGEERTSEEEESARPRATRTQNTSATERDVSSSVRFEAMSGQQFTVGDLEGQVVLVNFWATYCGPCRSEIPVLNDLYADLQSEGLEIVGVALDSDGRKVVEPFSDEYNVEYPVVLDPSASHWRTFADQGRIPLPTTFILDSQGTVVRRVQGEFPAEKLRPELRRMLGVESRETEETSAQTEPDEQPSDSEQTGRPSKSKANLSSFSVSFYGLESTVEHNPSLFPTLDGKVGKESIGSFWRALSEEEYESTLASLRKKREELELGDWAYYNYLHTLAKQLYEQNGHSSTANEATLWTWFMMIQSGYAVRVGFWEDDVFLMLPVEGKIYDLPQDYLDGQRYYLMRDGGGSYRTYEGQHEKATKVLDIDERILPDLAGDTESRTTSFSYDDERYEISYEYDTAVLDYVRSAPSFEYSVLFKAGVSSAAESSLLDALRPHVENRSPRNALNFLLRFVQFATEYEVSDEKFPEQSLAGTPSDCEDRAVLFAYLVRSLLNRPMVGLDWPNHVATAVKAGEGLEAASDDETVEVDGDTYIVADPTYIKSDLGMKMSSPPLQETEPGLIRF